MAINIGKVGSFDDTIETWESNTERIEQFFIVNQVHAGRKVASPLTVIGPKTYSLLKKLCAPENPAGKAYGDLINLLNSHLMPKPSVIAETPGESVSSFVAELRKLAIHCNFAETLNDTLQYRFVCGLRHEHTQKRLLAETKQSTSQLLCKLPIATPRNCRVSEVRYKL